VTQEVIEPTTLMAVVATGTMVSQSYRQHQWHNVCFIPLKEAIQADIYAIYDSRSERGL
jgi:hypothetical protein